MSTEDGPGLRTTVFFKGCTLKCAWCHNPESIDFLPAVEWRKARCIGCMSCAAVCPEKAIIRQTEGIFIRRAACKRCGLCVDACPAAALGMKGERYTVKKLFNELKKDAPYFGPSGGVTLSGGEALAQADFAGELLQMLDEAGIHTAVDTAGHVPFSVFEKVLPHTKLFLYDIKAADGALHERFTGADNTLILANLQKLDASGARIWIRTPVIPGATDTDENIQKIGAYLRTLCGNIERWELCAFNNLCRSKYEMAGTEWQFAAAPLMTETRMKELVIIAQKSAGERIPVSFTGATARE